MLHTKWCQNKTLFFTFENTKDYESLQSIVEVSYIILNTRTDLTDRLRISAIMLLKYCLECNICCLPRHFEINVHLFYKKATKYLVANCGLSRGAVVCHVFSVISDRLECGTLAKMISTNFQLVLQSQPLSPVLRGVPIQ